MSYEVGYSLELGILFIIISGPVSFIFYLRLAFIALQHYAIKYDVSASQLEAFLDDVRFPLTWVSQLHWKTVIPENLEKMKREEREKNFNLLRLGISFPIWFTMLVFAGILIHHPLLLGIDLAEDVISIGFIACWRFGHNLPRYSGR